MVLAVVVVVVVIVDVITIVVVEKSSLSMLRCTLLCVFPEAIAPKRHQARMTGSMAKEAIRQELNVNRGARGAHTLRFTCSPECGKGGTCHMGPGTSTIVIFTLSRACTVIFAVCSAFFNLVPDWVSTSIIRLYGYKYYCIATRANTQGAYDASQTKSGLFLRNRNTADKPTGKEIS